MPIPIIGSVTSDFGAIVAGASLGTVGTDLFEGTMPASPSNCIAVFDGVGKPPIRTSAKSVPAERPRVFVSVRNADYETGYNLAYAVRKLLQNWSGVINGNTYFDITSDGPIFGAGRNERGEYLFSLYFLAYRGTR